jgi:hypothetical protein
MGTSFIFPLIIAHLLNLTPVDEQKVILTFPQLFSCLHPYPHLLLEITIVFHTMKPTEFYYFPTGSPHCMWL